MIKPTPNPPQLTPASTPVTRSVPFGDCLGSQALFTVREGIDLEDALIHASERMNCASATACALIDHSHPDLQALARAVMHQIEVGRALVEASIAGLQA